jgi:hypothetical protein
MSIIAAIDRHVPGANLAKTLESLAEKENYPAWDVPDLQMEFASVFDGLIARQSAQNERLCRRARFGPVTFELMLNDNWLNTKRNPSQEGGDPYFRIRQLSVKDERQSFQFESRSFHLGPDNMQDLSVYRRRALKNLRRLYICVDDTKAALPPIAQDFGLTETTLGRDLVLESERSTHVLVEVNEPDLKQIFGIGIKVGQCLSPEMFVAAAF